MQHETCTAATSLVTHHCTDHPHLPITATNATGRHTLACVQPRCIQALHHRYAGRSMPCFHAPRTLLLLGRTLYVT